MRRQQGMRLDDRYVLYLQMVGLYHLARLNDRWFRLDEPFVSAFVERWRPETHIFHMPFGECTITLPRIAWCRGVYGSDPILISAETFEKCPEGADKETVRRYARAYIMMLLGIQLFADKPGNRVHIRWLPYVARIEEMGGYSWGLAALTWLNRCMCRVTNRHVVKLAGPLQLLQSWIFWHFPGFRPAGYDMFSWPLASRWAGHNPSASKKGPWVQMWRLRIDLLQAGDFIWMPYSSPDVLQVMHLEVLEPHHTALWRCVTALIYFTVIEWHHVDRVLPQFGGV
ncbi:protein MAIN-LIKE 1-like [Arachis duranensis]|uniref:Protein MAIN-LIKE 1-like n=1 Tax=Arachis duranensis TaxID=130453 RepID=A0A6P4BA98_ARADU|nr:protein MAIN-LIKE 1-like [Arachis duranensis]